MLCQATNPLTATYTDARECALSQTGSGMHGATLEVMVGLMRIRHRL